MRILLLTDGIYPYVIGGMQKHSFNLCKHLIHKGIKVCLVHCVPKGDKIVKEEEVYKVMDLNYTEQRLLEVHCLEFPKPGKFPGHYIKASYDYSREIYKRFESRLGEFDFIYTKGFSAWHLLKMKEKGKKMPPVSVKFHGYEMYQEIPGLKNKLVQYLFKVPVRWNNRKADYVFSYGGKITKLIYDLGVPESKVIELPSGIDSSWLRSGPKEDADTVNFFFIGRYERRKGIEEINQAVSRLKDKYPQNKFHFIGPIPEDRRISSKNGNVLYHGKIMEFEGITNVMDQCQILLCPSYSEGMPNVILEGMSRGLGIIATDVGAVSSLVNDQNGWMIPKGDSNALYQTMKDIIERGEIGGKGEASCQRIENEFLWEKVIEQFIVKVSSIVD